MCEFFSSSPWGRGVEWLKFQLFIWSQWPRRERPFVNDSGATRALHGLTLCTEKQGMRKGYENWLGSWQLSGCVVRALFILLDWPTSGQTEMKQGTIYDHGSDIIFFSPWGGGPAGASSKRNSTKYRDLSHVVKESPSWPSQLCSLISEVPCALCSCHRNIAKILSKASAALSHVLCKKQKWHLFMANWIKVDYCLWCQVTSKTLFDLNSKNPAWHIALSFQKWYFAHAFPLPPFPTLDSGALLFWLGSSLWDFIHGGAHGSYSPG